MWFDKSKFMDPVEIAALERQARIRAAERDIFEALSPKGQLLATTSPVGLAVAARGAA